MSLSQSWNIIYQNLSTVLLLTKGCFWLALVSGEIPQVDLCVTNF